MQSKYGFTTGARDGLSNSVQRLSGTGRTEDEISRGMVTNNFPSEGCSKFLPQEILAKLDAVTARLDTVANESVREASILKADLESEKEARRAWQDKSATLRDRLSSMVRKS